MIPAAGLGLPPSGHSPLESADDHVPLPVPTRQRRTGLVLSGVAVLFLTVDAVMKLLRVPAAVEGTVALGYPEHVIVPLGVLQVVCLALYLHPRTAVLGALLWAGYLGGAVATHVRVGNPLFSHVLFPIYVAALLWLGLWLRDRRLREVLPLS